MRITIEDVEKNMAFEASKGTISKKDGYKDSIGIESLKLAGFLMVNGFIPFVIIRGKTKGERNKYIFVNTYRLHLYIIIYKGYRDRLNDHFDNISINYKEEEDVFIDIDSKNRIYNVLKQI